MNLISTIIVASLIDCLNPATIITQLLLLIKTRSLLTSATFIATTFIVYFISGLLLYYGVAENLKTWLSGIKINTSWIFVSEIILLLVCFYFFFKKNKRTKEDKISGKKKINNWTVIALGIGSTLSDVPTAIPYFAFIGQMEKIAPSPKTTIISFLAYVLIYVLPMLAIHFIYYRNQYFIIQKAISLELLISKIGIWAERLILASLVIFLVVDIARHLFGMNSLLISA